MKNLAFCYGTKLCMIDRCMVFEKVRVF